MKCEIKKKTGSLLGSSTEKVVYIKQSLQHTLWEVLCPHCRLTNVWGEKRVIVFDFAILIVDSR